MKLNILFYSVLHSGNRTFWIWEVWKPYNHIWKDSKHVHYKTRLIKTSSIPLTRMLLLQGKLHGALSFWRGILLQPGVGVEGLPLSPTQAWPPWSWGGGACECQVWAGDPPSPKPVQTLCTEVDGLPPTFHVVLDSSSFIRLDLDMLCKQLCSSISSRWRVDGCDFWIENLKLLEFSLPLPSHSNFPLSRQGVAMTQFVVRMWPSVGRSLLDSAFHSGERKGRVWCW